MKNLILIFLISMFFISSTITYADTKSKIRKFDTTKRIERRSFDKKYFHHKRKPAILDRQRDIVNIYFVSGNIACAAITYLIPKRIRQHMFIKVQVHHSKYSYAIGIRKSF